MKRVWLALASLGVCAVSLAAAGATTGIAAPTAAGSAAGGEDGITKGHVKALPKFVVKKEQERLAAADLVARGQASADANGIVTLKNGKRVQYRQQGEE